ncbi:MAG TPA: hypothetical protein VH083_27265 [Myxococcales bacterium]|jgi:hypothetical protein|nr:hypothetical protein [Myxococcales bacterium]
MKRFLVIEDGREYSDRFGRFLSSEFSFERATSFAQAAEAWRGCAGLLLDLDFRRTQAALLVDEAGAPAPKSAAEIQGILILRALRKRGCELPALLFADFDDGKRASRLEAELGPLRVIASSESLPTIAGYLRGL